MSLHASMISLWYHYHETSKGFRPTNFSGSDASAIKKIRIRIQSILTEKTDENSLAIWKAVLNYLPKEKWLSTQDLPVINQKFDQILCNLKNERNTKTESDRINTALAAKYANL